MTTTVAFDVDGVLTCSGCSPQRQRAHQSQVQQMIDNAADQGYSVGVATARQYPQDGVWMATSLNGVSPEVTQSLRRANNGQIPVCSRPSGSGPVAERKMACLSKLSEHFEMQRQAGVPNAPKATNRAILVEDNTQNYVRAGSLVGQMGHAMSPEGVMLTAGVLVPNANGVTAETVSQLARAMNMQRLANVMETQHAQYAQVTLARSVLQDALSSQAPRR